MIPYLIFHAVFGFVAVGIFLPHAKPNWKDALSLLIVFVAWPIILLIALGIGIGEGA